MSIERRSNGAKSDGATDGQSDGSKSDGATERRSDEAKKQQSDRKT